MKQLTKAFGLGGSKSSKSSKNSKNEPAKPKKKSIVITDYKQKVHDKEIAQITSGSSKKTSKKSSSALSLKIPKALIPKAFKAKPKKNKKLTEGELEDLRLCELTNVDYDNLIALEPPKKKKKSIAGKFMSALKPKSKASKSSDAASVKSQGSGLKGFLQLGKKKKETDITEDDVILQNRSTLQLAKEHYFNQNYLTTRNLLEMLQNTINNLRNLSPLLVNERQLWLSELLKYNHVYTNQLEFFQNWGAAIYNVFILGVHHVFSFVISKEHLDIIGDLVIGQADRQHGDLSEYHSFVSKYVGVHRPSPCSKLNYVRVNVKDGFVADLVTEIHGYEECYVMNALPGYDIRWGDQKWILGWYRESINWMTMDIAIQGYQGNDIYILRKIAQNAVNAAKLRSRMFIKTQITLAHNKVLDGYFEGLEHMQKMEVFD